VKIGLILPLFSGDPERVLSFAERAEELGFDGLFAFDHLFPPAAPPDRPALEAFTMVAAVAARTPRVAVGTLVTRAPLRGPGTIAKLSVSLADASGGRMILGIGAGDHDNPEHRVFGIDEPDDAREHLAETVRSVRALLEGRPWLGGTYVLAMPGPLLPPATVVPPVWVGGASDDVVRLAAAEADAWNGWQVRLEAFERKARLLQDEAAGRTVEATWAGVVVVGRDDDEVDGLLEQRERSGRTDRTWAGTASSLRTWLDDLEGAGATWAVLALGGPADRIELIGSEVLSRARA
jgi:alkanesulfonate monooxygenase SsuD/methylene tetrahydromethanopterin reductase-like flavin-dependent oxidoreductase (luciferase family)